MTENIVTLVEKFLTYSDEKLEELSLKNQQLKVEKNTEKQEK